MPAFRNIFVSIAISFVAVSTASARVAHDVPEPDSTTGFYWQRIIDPGNPAAPPRLIPVHGSAAPSVSRTNARRPVACVRAGEHLLLHETRMASSTVSLGAIALQSGACGDRIRARIEVTGAFTEITVLGHGMGALGGKEDKWR
jgi:hypothetical protein